VLTLAVLSAVLVANGSSIAQAATPGSTVPPSEQDATTTTVTTTAPDTAAPSATAAEATAPTTTTPTTTTPTEGPTNAAAAASVPCEGAWKNFWFGNNSVTGTVVIGDKGKAVPQHTVAFDVSSKATETCTVYAQIFTYDGPAELPQTAVATSQIVLEPGQSKHVELTTSECRIQADLVLTKYDTVQWPGMNWDDYIASDVSTCPPPPPCQTSNGTTVQPGYAVLDGDHVLVRSTSDHPEKRAFVVYALPGTKAPADNNDLSNVVLTLVQGLTLVGPPVMGTTDNCASVPVPKCQAYAIVEIDATTTPLPRVFLSVSPKALEILGKTGLDLTKLLDVSHIDVNAVLAAILKLSQDDLNTLVTELLNQPGLKMPFFSVNWFSVEACPNDPGNPPPGGQAVAPAQEAAVLAASDTPSAAVAATGALPTTGTNTSSEIAFGLFLVLMGVGFCCLARYRKVR
jgi:hypothetical protein